MLSREELIEVLYNKAMGDVHKNHVKNLDREQVLKYGVCLYESNNLISRSNIEEYIDAVDEGYTGSYSEFCISRKKRWF